MVENNAGDIIDRKNSESRKKEKSEKRIRNEEIINDIVQQGLVKSVDINDRVLFDKYRLKNRFADTTFAMLYAWQPSCSFVIHPVGGVICCIGIGIDDELSGGFIRGDETDIDECLDYLLKILPTDEGLILDNIVSEDVALIKAYCVKRGYTPKVSYDEDFSDYIYYLDDYLSLSGRDNKNKRGSMNWLLRNYPGIRHEYYSEKLRSDVCQIFSGWCEYHSCRICTFGCEYQAFNRLMDVYDESLHICSVVYIDDKPAAFSLCERINADTIACLMQKTLKPIRGLAYYASHCIRDKYGSVTYIDLCEDMGLTGLREDKMGLHPIRLEKKYRVVIHK